MHALSPLALALALSLAAPAALASSCRPAPPLGVAGLAPPVAERRPVRVVQHGVERIDDYAWLRAGNWREALARPSTLPAEIRAHLDAENAYAERTLAPLDALKAALAREMAGRVEPEEAQVPVPDGSYAYARAFVAGAEHPRVVRTARDGSDPLVVVDGAELARGKAYFNLGGFSHSPDHRFLAYSVDETGAEKFSVRIRDVASGQDLPDRLADVSSFAWAEDGRTLVYSRLDSEHRALSVHRHALGADGPDPLVYREADPAFSADVYRARSGRFLIVSTGNLETSEAWLIDARRPDAPPRLVAPRVAGERYFVDDDGERLVIRTNAGRAPDFKVVSAPSDASGRDAWTELVPHRPGRTILGIAAYRDHLARLEVEEGLPRIVVRRRDGAEHDVAFPEEAYALDLVGGYEHATTTMRFRYSSPTTPPQVFDYDMESRARTLRREQRIPSGHDPSAYVVRRLQAPAPDGEAVPVTVLHRRGQALDGSAPVFLEGYGAYSYLFPADFQPNILSLVDRGVVYAIAHARGGLEKGDRWRNGGRLQSKPATFTDFIAAAEHLARERYGASGRTVAFGASAGGLLMGAVANMRPELFAGIVARVPFVDALNTMSDDSLPLTASDVPEWGDPIRDPAAFRVIASYSPYDNVKAQAYPAMLVTAGIADPRVTYWEPAKWVARLRATKTDDRPILLATRMAAGHFGAAGRFEGLDEVATIYAFALSAAGACAQP
ncbi:MAG TPA: S9 family peptidase [Salinarimonas sp.]|nr:S9 family peptidase [Salinarimonas sp.]